MRLLPLLLLASCAELRSGWVKVDFMEGHPSEYLVCHLQMKDGEMFARCVSLETVEAEVQKRHETEQRSKQGDL